MPPQPTEPVHTRVPYFDPMPWRCHRWWDPMPDWPKLDKADLLKFTKLEVKFRLRELELQLEKAKAVLEWKNPHPFDPEPPMLEALLGRDKLEQFGKLRLDRIKKDIENEARYLEDVSKTLETL